MLPIFRQTVSRKYSLPLVRELQILFVGALTLFLAVALLTYRYTDCSWFYFDSAATKVGNWCGPVGACCAALLYYLFGAAGWMVVIFCFYWLYFLYTYKTMHEEWDRLIAYGILLFVLAALCACYNVSFAFPGVPGGYFGRILWMAARRLFDMVGGLLFLGTLASASLIIIARVSFFDLMRRLYRIATHRKTHALLIRPVRNMVVGMQVTVKLLIFTLKWHIERFLYASDKQVDQHHAPLSSYHDAMDASYTHEEGEASHTIPQDTPPHAASEAHAESFEETLAKEGVDEEMVAQSAYQLPKLDMFIGVDEEQHDHALMQELEKRAHTLQEKLERFGVFGTVTAIKRGPVVTLFEYQPHIDTKISKIIALEDDLALALQATSIRIIAPIPGRSVVGFEVANKQRRGVLLAHLIKTASYQETTAALPMILGVDTIGNTILIDLAKMPHLLIAGSTGSGKSVALNAMLISLLCKVSPDDLRLVIIDPKRLEFAPYADIAHLLFPIVTDPKVAPPVLRWVVKQMEARYETMAKAGARNIADYRLQAKKTDLEPMPYIIVIIDELADLMMTAGKEVEDAITRITQMARAAGIHLIAATQRPSVDVITGLIKVNFPSRISFRVTSKIDSRTILDAAGADKLLGRGDMLFLDANDALLKRIHGAYVLDKEINQVIAHIKEQRAPNYYDLKTVCQDDRVTADFEQDIMYEEICRFIEEIDEVSISLLQRRFRIGYNRSARIIDMLESQGLISPSCGGKTRKVIR